MTILRRSAVILREEGLLVLCSRIFGETIYRRMLLMEHLLEKPSFACQKPSAFSSCWLSPDEAPRYASFIQKLTEEEICRRLSAGDRCFIGEIEGRIVHGFWVSTSNAWIDFLNLDLPLKPWELYLYQTFTPLEMRGRGVATATLASALEMVRREGFRRVLCCIQLDRAIAYPPPLRTGFVPSALISSVRFGPRRWVFHRPTSRLPCFARHLPGRRTPRAVFSEAGTMDTSSKPSYRK